MVHIYTRRLTNDIYLGFDKYLWCIFTLFVNQIFLKKSKVNFLNSKISDDFKIFYTYSFSYSSSIQNSFYDREIEFSFIFLNYVVILKLKYQF